MFGHWTQDCDDEEVSFCVFIFALYNNDIGQNWKSKGRRILHGSIVIRVKFCGHSSVDEMSQNFLVTVSCSKDLYELL